MAPPTEQHYSVCVHTTDQSVALNIMELAAGGSGTLDVRFTTDHVAAEDAVGADWVFGGEPDDTDEETTGHPLDFLLERPDLPDGLRRVLMMAKSMGTPVRTVRVG